MNPLHLIGAKDYHDILIITFSVLFAKGVEYIGVKIFTKIDSMIHSPLDIPTADCGE